MENIENITAAEYINALSACKKNLTDILNSKGIIATVDEDFLELINKVDLLYVKNVEEVENDFLHTVMMNDKERLEYLFYKCTNLKTLPKISPNDYANNGTFTSMCEGCTNLKDISQVDFSRVRDATKMFKDCSSLEYVPNLDNLPNLKISDYMFSGCSSLKEVPPDMGVESVVMCSGMFRNCSSLKSVPKFEQPMVDGSSVFQGCSSLTYIDMFNATYLGNTSFMFSNCSALETISSINISNSSLGTCMFSGCTSLKNIKFEGTIKIELSFEDSPNLTVESLLSIIDALYTRRSTSSPASIVLGDANIAKLSTEQLQRITDKNWQYQ